MPYRTVEKNFCETYGSCVFIHFAMANALDSLHEMNCDNILQGGGGQNYVKITQSLHFMPIRFLAKLTQLPTLLMLSSSKTLNV